MCRRAQTGISLIEVMIVVAIIGILAVAGVPAFIQYLGNAQVRNGAEDVSSAIQRMRLLAVETNQRLNIDIRPTAVSAATRAGTSVAQRDLPALSRVQLTGVPLSLEVDGRGSFSADASLDIQPQAGQCRASGGDVLCLRVRVLAGGAVQVCDPSLPKENPRSCAA